MPQVLIGNFTKPTGGAPATVDVDLGMTPKVIFFQTVEGTSMPEGIGNLNMGWGCAVWRPSGVEESCIAGFASDGSAAGARYNANGKAIAAIQIAGVRWEADCTFLYANHGGETTSGFRLTFTTNTANADYIQYMALAGDDITDAQIATVQTDTSSSSFTASFDFWPSAVIYFTDGQNTANNHSTDGPVFNHMFYVFDPGGGAGGDFSQNCYGFGIDDTGADYVGIGQTSASTTSGNSDVNATAAADMIAASSLDTAAPGVTLTVFGTAASAHKIFALGIQGGKWGTKRQQAPGAAGSQSITGLGFQGRGILAIGGVNSSAAGTGDLQTSWGFSDVTTHQCVSGTVERRAGVGGDDTAKGSRATMMLEYISSAFATVSTVTPTSLDSDGLTVTWGTAGGSTRWVHYLIVGDGPVYDYDEGW